MYDGRETAQRFNRLIESTIEFHRSKRNYNKTNKDMNENVDLIKILKNCPRGFKLYSAVHGELLLALRHPAQ